MATKLKPTAVPAPEPVEGGWDVRGLTTNPTYQQWPHRLVFWDCEAEQLEGGAFAFALAHARLYVRDGDPGEHTYEPQAELLVESPQALWETIDSWTRAKDAMRLYASQHVFDLGVSGALDHLRHLGYTFQPGRDMVWSASGDAPYLRMHRGTRAALTFIDTVSLFHHGTARLARDLDRGEQPSLDELAERCQWDTATIAAAVLRYLERLRGLGVTPRGLTGPGNGFHLMRTLHLIPGSVHHHQDAALYEAEDQSRKLGGRREAWRHGRLEQPLYDWDYRNAHAVICLAPVPSRPRLKWEGPKLSGAGVTALQEWIVETDVPCVPYHDPNRGTIYPVGRFPATLWGPEATLALDEGARLVPGGRRWEYDLRLALRPWAEWVLEQLEDADPIWVHACKAWSQTVPGKWGQSHGVYELADHHSPIEAVPFAEGQAFVVGHCGRDYWQGFSRIIRLPHETWGVRDEQEPADHANYAIQSWIMSQARIRLWRAMRAAGLPNVVTVNTDGLVVDEEGNRRLERARIDGLRMKHKYREGADVRNAQGLIDLDDAHPLHKIGGLPRGSEQVGPETWATEVWHQSLVDGPSALEGVWRMPPGPLGRIRRPEGRTEPYRAAK